MLSALSTKWSRTTKKLYELLPGKVGRRGNVTEKCALCQKDLNPYDVGVAREVKGWVSGPKRDHMRLRLYTGRHAHDACVTKLLNGQAVDQPSLLEDTPATQDPESTGGELGW